MDVDGWRKQIDEIDLELVKLLNRRSHCAIKIGKIKEELGIGVYDPNREEEVIGKILSVTDGPLTKEAMCRLFERIIDESRRAEREHRSNEANKRS